MKQHGIYLSWENISAQIKGKDILNNISGYCSPGSSLAIMGPSGAGKTTLLSILARKYGSDLKVTGQILANNTKYNQTTFYSFGSFVYQNDILNEALTVRQTLQFVGRLKIKDRVKVDERVEQLIRQFTLKKCENTYVGGKFIKGISGGEKKRLCIAVQIINKPDLVILDEPTSGLDSNMANNVLKILNKLAKKEGKTIIFTIHQPSYKMFTELDRLFLLDKGSCIFQGQAGGIVQYILSLNIAIPTNTTICDFFMFQISQFKARNNGNYQTKLNSISYEQKIRKDIDKQIKQSKEISPDGFSMALAVQNFAQQFKILMQRQVKLFVRNPMKLGRGIGNSILMIILLGIIFLHSISENRPVPNQAYNNKYQLLGYFFYAQGTSFVVITSVLMTGIFSVALVFPTQRQVFTKETASKTYNALPYFISKLIVQVTTLLFAVLIFGAGVYWLIGYSSDFVQFLKFIMVLFSAVIVGNSIGFWTGSLLKDAQKSAAMAPVFLLPLMMFSGLYNKLDSIPKWISWLQYISPYRYALHAVLVNEYNDEKYILNGKEFSYREDLAINLDFWQNIGLLFALSGLYFILAFVFLKKLSSKISA